MSNLMTHAADDANDPPSDASESVLEAGATQKDPRALLAEWANASDEWVRLLVAEVIASGRPIGESTAEKAYELFRQEKALDKRTLPVVEQLTVEPRQDDAAPPLSLVRLSDVRGVNALVAGAIIEPHAGLTILFGENGTGKAGYARIFKALAASRTAGEILGNIEVETDEPQAAKIDYTVGETAVSIEWGGERGIAPFTRMSIFDSPSVTTHVDVVVSRSSCGVTNWGRIATKKTPALGLSTLVSSPCRNAQFGWGWPSSEPCAR